MKHPETLDGIDPVMTRIGQRWEEDQSKGNAKSSKSIRVDVETHDSQQSSSLMRPQSSTPASGNSKRRSRSGQDHYQTPSHRPPPQNASHSLPSHRTSYPLPSHHTSRGHTSTQSLQL